MCNMHQQPYTKLMLGEDYTRDELVSRCLPFVPKSLPQVFIGEIHAGGARELETYLKNILMIPTL